MPTTAIFTPSPYVFLYDPAVTDADETRYERLIARARSGETILIDGATGSECTRRGVQPSDHGWSGGATLTHPEIVRSIHDDYLDIGVDFLASNTFAAGRNIMRDVGDDASFEQVNRQAVELAVSARDAAGERGRDAVVAGGISNWSFSGNHPTLDQLHADTVAQATIMQEAGADLLSLEMMVDIERFTVTLQAAASVGLPLWVGFSVGPDLGHEPEELGEHIQLRDGGLLEDAVALAAGHGAVDAICIMHTDVRLVERSLATVRDGWNGPLGAYAHASAIIDGEFTHDGVLTPNEYVAYLPAWQRAGATMLGGCCGIGPDHLRAMAALLAEG